MDGTRHSVIIYTKGEKLFGNEMNKMTDVGINEVKGHPILTLTN